MGPLLSASRTDDAGVVANFAACLIPSVTIVLMGLRAAIQSSPVNGGAHAEVVEQAPLITSRANHHTA